MHSCYNTKILVYHYFSDDGDIINILPDEDNPKWKVNIIVSQDHMKPYVRLRTRKGEPVVKIVDVTSPTDLTEIYLTGNICFSFLF